MFISKKLKSVAVLFIMVAMLSLVVGCDDENGNPTETEYNMVETQSDNIVVNDYIIIDASFQTNILEIAERLEQVKSLSIVQSAFSMFNNNYSYTEEYSYIVNGTAIINDSTDTVDVEIVTLAMTYDVNIQERVVYISYIVVSDKGWVLQSNIVSFVTEDPNDDYELILQTEEVQVWMKSFPGLYSKYIQPMTQWSWSSWLKCSGKYTAAGCGGAAVGCALSGPGYGACVAGGCAGSAAASMIGCALDQVF